MAFQLPIITTTSFVKTNNYVHSTSCCIPMAQTRDSFVKYKPSSSSRSVLSCTLSSSVKDMKQRIITELSTTTLATTTASYDQMKQLEMIDAIQKLGIDYLFKKEITETLHQVYHTTLNSNGQNLHEVALRFRLLRQEGYNVKCDLAFSYFKDGDGKFKQLDQLLTANNDDLIGLESLFEASQMSTPSDEDTTTLDEAYDFCLQNLIINSSEGCGCRSPALFLRALKHPDHYKVLSTFMVSNKDVLNRLKKTNDSTDSWRNDLSKLADHELKMTRNLYKKEMDCFIKWWKELELTKGVKFARDEPIEWYTMSITIVPTPMFSEIRLEIAKLVSIIYVVDDIFDVNEVGHEDLVMFAGAVNRWEFDSIDHELPEYMRICLKAIFDTTGEISGAIWSKYGWNPQASLQKQWADLFSAFLVESKWLTSGESPTSEEYLRIGTVTSGVPFILTFMLFFLGERGKEEGGSNCLRTTSSDNETYPSIISSTATIFRLWDDLVQDVDQEGLDGSYVQCYMNEHKGTTTTSFDDARQHVIRMIWDEWKRLNECCVLLSRPGSFSSSFGYVFSKTCVNLARMAWMMHTLWLERTSRY